MRRSGPSRSARLGAPDRLGLRMALLGAAIALAAVNTGNNLLYLMLSLLAAMGIVSFLLARAAARRIEVEMILPEQATAGMPFLAAARVRGRFPLLPQAWVDLRLEGLPCSVELSVPIDSRRGRGVGSSRAVVPLRGVYGDLVLRASTLYPLGLSRAGRRFRLARPLVVLPRFEPLRELRPRASAGRGDEPRSPRAGAGSGRPGPGPDLLNLRPFTPHDNARHVDWRSTARTGRLMVREFERESARRLDIVLDRRPCQDAAFERAVSRCAALLDLAGRERLDARLLVPGLADPLRGAEAMRFLAGVAVAAGATAPDPAAPKASGDAEVVIVSADPALDTCGEGP